MADCEGGVRIIEEDDRGDAALRHDLQLPRPSWVFRPVGSSMSFGGHPDWDLEHVHLRQLAERALNLEIVFHGAWSWSEHLGRGCLGVVRTGMNEHLL